jgi:hypothetical protein
MRHKKLFAIISLFAMSISLQTQAAPSCQEVIAAADRAIEAKNKEIQICRLALDQTIDRALTLEKDVKDRDEKLSSPLRNPFVMATAGVLLGLVVAGYVRK